MDLSSLLCVFACVCVYVSIYIYIYVCMCACVYTSTYTQACTFSVYYFSSSLIFPLVRIPQSLPPNLLLSFPFCENCSMFTAQKVLCALNGPTWLQLKWKRQSRNSCVICTLLMNLLIKGKADLEMLCTAFFKVSFLTFFLFVRKKIHKTEKNIWFKNIMLVL